MIIRQSTNNQFLGYQITESIEPGSVINLDGFKITIQFKLVLNNGIVIVGNPNYILNLEN